MSRWYERCGSSTQWRMQQGRRISWIIWYSQRLSIKWRIYAAQFWNILELENNDKKWTKARKCKPILSDEELTSEGGGYKAAVGGGGNNEAVCWCTCVCWCWWWCISVLKYGGGGAAPAVTRERSWVARNLESNSLRSISASSAKFGNSIHEHGSVESRNSWQPVDNTISPKSRYNPPLRQKYYWKYGF